MRAIDGFIEKTQPFRLAKDETKRGEVGTILYTCAEALRIASLLLWPALPGKCEQLLTAIGCGSYVEALANNGLGKLDEWAEWGQLAEGTEVNKTNLFPRHNKPKKKPEPKPKAKKEKKKKAPVPSGPKDEISYEEFVALDLRIARVKTAKAVEKADRLLHLELELADGELRTVLSGIREYYSPEELIGKQVVYLANLAPRKIRGVVSQGMVLAGNDADGGAVLLQPLRELPDGAKIS